MTNEEAIAQLYSLRDNSQSFLEEGAPDSIWAQDIRALDIAIRTLEEQTKQEE